LLLLLLLPPAHDGKNPFAIYESTKVKERPTINMVPDVADDFQKSGFEDSPNVQKVENGGQGPQAYMVSIPDGVIGGQQFPVTIQGQQITATCPMGAVTGTKVRIVPPPPGPMLGQSKPKPDTPDPAPKDDDTQLFEVRVPAGVNPGSPFALLAGRARDLITCPGNAGAGQRIRFNLPLALPQKREPQSEALAIKLSYKKNGWARTIRLSDMKFQWVRMDDNGDVDTNTRFNADKSAYVRKIEFRDGKDPRVRDGIISLVPAAEASCDSCIKGSYGTDVVTYAEIADAQVKNFEDKQAWFQDKCAMFSVEWNARDMRMNVRRDFLLEDSVDAVMSLSRKDLRKLWRFELTGEVCGYAGGLAREWFELVTAEIFDPDKKLWQSSESNQMCMMINPDSSKSAAVVTGDSCGRRYVRSHFLFLSFSCQTRIRSRRPLGVLPIPWAGDG
jgi:hypothetical protein